MATVNVIYHHYPHYRAPILRELAKNGKHDYRFWGSVEEIEGIKPFEGDDVVSLHSLRFKKFGRFWLLSGYFKPLFDKSADVIIVLGNPNMPSSVVLAIIGRLIGKKVMYWAHGWLKKYTPIIAYVRNIYFNIPHSVLVYGDRAVDLATEEGFPEGKVRAIYNSLDFERSQISLEKVINERAGSAKPQELYSEPERPLLICTARITALCRFDVLLHAARKLADMGRPVNILLVGEGPERSTLTALAAELDISVHFYGACYDEDEIARLIYWSDLTVSPGKIGLTAIHTLTYGTPAITHDNLDLQMPEVEAIQPGITGDFFNLNDPDDLARSIANWLDRPADREATRSACRAVIAEKWNPANQRRLIDETIDGLLRGAADNE